MEMSSKSLMSKSDSQLLRGGDFIDAHSPSVLFRMVETAL